MALDCVYVLAQQDDPSSVKNAGKERAEAGLDSVGILLIDCWWTSNVIARK
ncbi:hypothetical protein [Methanosarcina sp.]|uniref:hypothetical protein n=1 Tax=Methanosarcina sp. TaxID=2213 RepID=UPI002AB8651E|nr:hypothetical protein [Methanosarcina sp.]MDY9927875.1 hypothetical protein [Methanosarcina sp.]